MDNLIANSRTFTRLAESQRYKRPLYDQIKWNWRLSGIRGPRGVGKTTLLLQRLLEHDPEQKFSIYITLDDLYFSSHLLSETIRMLHNTRKITHFYLDEVHKYPNWSKELKNIYDLLPSVKVFFTGSSIIQLYRQNVDLSRRAVMYDLQGFSFREFVFLAKRENLPLLTVEELTEPGKTAAFIPDTKIPILSWFDEYLNYGYYPIFLEELELYDIRVKQMIEVVLRIDLSSPESGKTREIRSLEKLLQLIAESPPFKPNQSKLAERLGLNRNTLARYINLLEEAQLIRGYPASGKGFSSVQKPEKLYLDNTNIARILSPTKYDIGALREIYFQNQLRKQGTLTIPKKGDFELEDTYIFEVGGRNKKANQVKSETNYFLAVADVEAGIGRQIPLWQFGLLA